MVDQVEEVKQKTDIISLISGYIELKKAGRNFKALCPFHSEKTPSFNVSPELQIYKCFGCNAGGDVYSFLEQYEGMEFYEALKFLADRAGIKLTPLSPREGGSKERLYKINSFAQYFYNYILHKHPAGKTAFNYLTEGRGLTLDTIRTFSLGYSPDRAFALKSYLVDKKKVSITELEKAGIVYRTGKGPIDRFRGRVIFPLHDHWGNTVGFAGRILPSAKSEGLAKYINTPETEVYHKSDLLYGLNLTKGDIKKTGSVLVMEGELDVISSWQAGIRNVVAIKGSALTEGQSRLISRFARQIILALDTDFAGNEAAMRGVEIAQKIALEVRVIGPYGFKDPDEAVQRNSMRFREAIKNSVSVWDFIINTVFSRYKNGRSLNAEKISWEILPVLSAISNKIVQAHYVNIVAKRLAVPFESVADQLREFRKNLSNQTKRFEVLNTSSKKGRRELLEERYLTLAFRYNPKYLLKRKAKGFISDFFVRRVVEELADFCKKNKKFRLSRFVQKLPKELSDRFSDLILKDAKGLEEELPERLVKELTIVENEIRVFDVKDRLKRLGEQIVNPEKKGEKDKVLKLQKKFTLLTEKLAKFKKEEFKGIILSN